MPEMERQVGAESEGRHGLGGRWILHYLVLSVILGQAGLAPAPASAETKSKSERQSDVISGTIEALDSAMLEVKIRTDVGRPVVVKVLNPDLLKDLTAGDRVTAQLDAEGKAQKITKLAIPELPEPAALPGGSEAGSQQVPAKAPR